MPDPALCTESANPNYTFGTFELFVTPEGEAEYSIGNISAGSFAFTPNLLEHRRGTDNSLDGIYAIGKDYTINFTADEITARNLGTLLNETIVDVAGGCKVPLSGDRCTREYGVRLLHTYPCADKTLEIQLWRAVILADFTLEFSATDWASVAGSIRALSCHSTHPAEPYGQIIINQACPTS